MKRPVNIIHEAAKGAIKAYSKEEIMNKKCRNSQKKKSGT